jgi:hypothetical protein
LLRYQLSTRTFLAPLTRGSTDTARNDGVGRSRPISPQTGEFWRLTGILRARMLREQGGNCYPKTDDRKASLDGIELHAGFIQT